MRILASFSAVVIALGMSSCAHTPDAESEHHHGIHEPHAHEHGPGCGHKAEQHGDHVDYEHDGHHHHKHNDHWHECHGPHETEAATAQGEAPPVKAPVKGKPGVTKRPGTGKAPAKRPVTK